MELDRQEGRSTGKSMEEASIDKKVDGRSFNRQLPLESKPCHTDMAISIEAGEGRCLHRARLFAEAGEGWCDIRMDTSTGMRKGPGSPERSETSA